MSTDVTDQVLPSADLVINRFQNLLDIRTTHRTARGTPMTVDELRATVSGPVFQRADRGFTEELLGQNLYVQHRPELVVGAFSTSDVQAAVMYAAQHQLHVSVLATGHEAQEAITAGLVITLNRMDTITIDETARTATVGGGARAGEVAKAAARFGLAPIAGSATTVGLTGLVLGGGLGPLARSHGYSSDYVNQFTVVVPTGEVLTVNKNENPELFWALRGGKGGFGVVIATQIRLVELATFYGGSVAFAEGDIEKVLRGWVEWTHTAPEEVTTSVAIMRFPPIPEIPEFMRGKTFLMLRFAYAGPAAKGQHLAAPLLALADPAFGELGELPAEKLGTIHEDPTEPTISWTDGTLLNGLDEAFVTALLDSVGEGRSTPFMVVEIRQLGGAARTDVAEGSAVSGRSSDYSLYVVGFPDPGLFETVLPDALDQLLRDIAPYVAPENFINWWSGRNLENFAKSWPLTTHTRLCELRTEWDPNGIFKYPVKTA
ncbi:MAG: FAD-binding oxidoreductase [Actinomycetota bacterium]